MFATASEIKNNFGKYLKHVIEESGEIIISKNNDRVARLVPYVSDLEKYYTIQEKAPQYDYNMKTVSYEEFLDIYAHTEARLEFLNGEIIVMDSPDVDHQEILGDLHLIFKMFFKGKPCKPFLAPFDVHFKKNGLKDPDVLQPDLILICDYDKNINEKRRYTGIPSLTLEILSDSTRSRDLVLKLQTYMLSGVSEYWAVDHKNKRITIFSFRDFKVEQIETFKPGEIAVSFCYDGLEVSVDSLFEGKFL